MKKILLVYIALICSIHTMYAQLIPVRNFRAVREAEKNTYNINNKKHSSFSSYYFTDFTDIDEFADSTSKRLHGQSEFSLRTNLQKEKFRINILPIFEIFYALNADDVKKSSFYLNGGGLFDLTLSDKLGLSYLFNYSFFINLPDFLKTENLNKTILNGYGQIFGTNRTMAINNDFKLTYMPYDFLKLELANSKNFFGDGYRSLFLSENAKNYPYFKIETQFLDFKYSCVWAYLNYYTYDENSCTANKQNDKLAVFHYFDWNITKRFSFGLFEAITASNKKFFDFEFLNPFVFFRPVDFSMGSPSNVIVGANFKYSINSNNAFYLQVAIDDIVVGQLFNDLKHAVNKNYVGEYGWFANKWAIQFGEKSFDIGGIKNLDGFIELNLARPYTYTQYNANNNYAHFQQALAHPLGANFVEIIGGLNYYFLKKFNIDLEFMFASLGLDISNTEHNGQNIFLPTMDGVHSGWQYIVSSYGNTLLQGNKTNIFTLHFDFSYSIRENLSVNCGAIVRHVNPENEFAANTNTPNSYIQKLNAYFYIGFRSNFGKIKMLY
ncbi:hypothetical protein LJC11_01315 [Bacteroidales bacterium OttesenSCG-928-I21]|nr:hypothetical protein [Bacteroidales bacterium OttesenSCG-928-I21]